MGDRRAPVAQHELDAMLVGVARRLVPPGAILIKIRIAAELGVRGRDGEIRTRGLLLPKQAR